MIVVVEEAVADEAVVEGMDVEEDVAVVAEVGTAVSMFKTKQLSRRCKASFPDIRLMRNP